MNVSLETLRSGLKTIRKDFKSILASDAPGILEEAGVELVSSKQRYDEMKRRKELRDNDSWGYRIYKEKPLRFIDSGDNRGGKLSVDLYCDIQWREEEDLPFSQDICLRVWSNEPYLIYRERWDSGRIKEELSDRPRSKAERVMHRMHFDKAEVGQQGPKYHLQFGGKPAEEIELCWFPETIKLPRLVHAPMDLILTCQLIAANFYRETYATIKKKTYWIGLVRHSQDHLLKNYYRKCLTNINDGKILLDELWNSTNKAS